MPIDKIKDIKVMYDYILEQMKCRKDKSLLKQFYNKVMEILEAEDNDILANIFADGEMVGVPLRDIPDVEVDDNQKFLEEK